MQMLQHGFRQKQLNQLKMKHKILLLDEVSLLQPPRTVDYQTIYNKIFGAPPLFKCDSVTTSPPSQTKPKQHGHQSA